MSNMVFKHPHFFWLLVLALIPLIIEFKRRYRSSSLAYSVVETMASVRPGLRTQGPLLLAFFRSIAIILVVISLARPQSGDELSRIHVEGISIELVVDNSGSMSEQDMLFKNKRMTRLQAVKDVIDGFIKARSDDLIGVTTFSSYPNEVCPLTLDYGVISKFMETVKPDNIFGQTAIGDGIVFASGLLKESVSKSKVMILLTDGMNNAGTIHPVDAARLAAKLGVKIYTIGIVPEITATGRRDIFGRLVFGSGQQIDSKVLKEVARIGSGKYYEAKDVKALKKIYAQIDKLEKTEQVTEKFLQYTELYHKPLIASFGLLLGCSLLSITIFRRIP